MELKLKDYLKKFETLLPVEVQIRNAAIDTVKQVVGISLDRKSVRVQGTQVFIHGSAALKSELVIKQQKITAHLAARYPNLGITAIR